MPIEVIHANLMNRKPTYPTSLPTFHSWRCRLCLRTCFFVLGYICNMHTFSAPCSK
jgi:hypothetical protein